MSSNNSGSSNNVTKQTMNAASNAGKAATNTYQKSSPIMKVVIVLVLILFISFIIYVIYVAYKAAQNASNNSPVVVNDVIDAYIARPAFSLPTVSEGMSQSFSTWIYVKDWNYRFGQYKNILWKGNPPNSSSTARSANTSNIHCPSLWLYPLTNSLKVITTTSAPENVESCDIQNIPLMTWVHIVYVLNNRTVDIYINGKLERSCVLRGIPMLTNDPVYLTTGSPQPGFYGKIGKTQYFTTALLPNMVADIYQKGPLGSSNYQVQFFHNGRLIDISTANSFAS